MLAIVGAGFKPRRTSKRSSECCPFDDIRTPRGRRQGEELAEQHPAARAVESAEEATRGDVVVTATSSEEPVIRARVAQGRRPHQRGRRVLPAHARAGLGHGRRLDVRRRQPRVCRERVGRLPHRARRRRDRRRSHRRGAGRRPRGTHPGRTSAGGDHGVRVAGNRRGRPLRGRVRRRRARESGRGIAPDF